MVQLNGSYKLDKSDNFDAFLKELGQYIILPKNKQVHNQLCFATGVSFVTRNLAKTATPTVEVSVNGDQYTIKNLSTLKNTEITFTLGVEFEEDRADGKKVKTVVTKDSDTKLTQVQKGDKEVTIVREFSDDALTVVSSQ